MARTLALRSHSVNDIKCETSRAKITGFFRQAMFHDLVTDNDDALHRNSFGHPAPLFFDFVLFHFIVKQATINLQAIRGLGLVAPRVS